MTAATAAAAPVFDLSMLLPKRLTPSSTSAKLVEHVLAPYDSLDDLEYVSYDYPSERTLEQNPGMHRINVLEHVRGEFMRRVEDADARKAMDRVFRAYKAIEGHNFDASDRYRMRWGTTPHGAPENVRVLDERHRVRRVSEFLDSGIVLPYFNADGSAADGYASFSVGGIHGAEWNKALYEHDLLAVQEAQSAFRSEHLEWEREVAERERFNKALEAVRSLHPDPGEALKADGGVVDLRDGGLAVPVRKLLTATGRYRRPAGMKSLLAREPRNPAASLRSPFLASGKLAERYALTSVGRMQHEDFKSYYPSMLRNMSAYYNEQMRSDAYLEIYDSKTRYGELADLYPALRWYYLSLRGGAKLMLNSASGASDTKPRADGSGDGSNHITMNNVILSMRLIGQMVTWLIGERQTLAGATITSTNTDGLYTSLRDDALNKRILDETAAPVHVAIDPEQLLLVSKDTNNRIEFSVPRDEDGREIDVSGDRAGKSGLHAEDLNAQSISGGSLAYAFGPDVTKSMDHPSVIDWVTSQFLGECALGNMPIDEEAPIEYCRSMIRSAWGCDERFRRSFVSSGRREPDVFTALNMFANVTSASTGKMTYPCGVRLDADDPERPSAEDIIPWGHVNRLFMVRPGVSAIGRGGEQQVMYACTAAGRKAGKSQLARLQREGLPITSLDDEAALEVLAHEHIVRSLDMGSGMRRLGSEHYAAIVRLKGLDADQPVIRVNRSLHWVVADPERRRAAFGMLDLEAYAQAAKAAIRKWVNLRS